MYDSQGSLFRPSPDGPFEDPHVHDQPTAQEHFTATREIKLINPRGEPLPTPSYRCVPLTCPETASNGLPCMNAMRHAYSNSV